MWIIGGVIVYILIMLGIGYWASKRIRDTKDYIIAGGKMGWLLSIGTIFATWFGAETCMGSSGTAFKKGILGVIVDPFGAGLCLILAGIFFAGYFKKQGFETIVDFFKNRYGKSVAWFLSIVYLPVYLGWIGAQLLAFGYILNSLTGFPLLLSVLIATGVVLIYTYAGGMWADAMTDFVQMLVLIIGLFIIFPILIKDIGGLPVIIKQTPPEYFYFYPKGSSFLEWANYMQAWMIVGIGSLPAQDLFSRIMAAKSPKVSIWSSIIAGVMYIAIGLIPVLIGIFGRLSLPSSSGEAILIELALKYLPSFGIAVMVGALLSAIMSSADSALLAPSSIIGHNIVPLISPSADDKLQLRWCKWSVPILGLSSFLLALYFKNIYRLCQESWGVLLTGVAAPMIMGVYWKRASSCGAFFGAIAGIIVWLICKIFRPEYPSNLIGFFVSLITIIIVTLFIGKKDRKIKGGECI